MITTLGKYLIKREIGSGAMGVVYEGFDPFIMRSVAIKTIQKSLIDQSGIQEVLGRFRREAQAAGRLTHPNIVSVYEYGEDGDMAFIVMEHIVGIELKDYFEMGKKFQIAEIADFMAQLLDALQFSHSRGVIHRDIKPANLMITKGGQLKIADFGIAKIESSNLTKAGTVLGSPAYMSPEQFRGISVDHRSDIYSAGVILYQFLTNSKPFADSDMTVVMQKVLNETPVPPIKLNASIPEALNAVVMKALAKQPEERFQSAAEFLEVLKSATGMPVSKAKAPAAEAPANNAGAALQNSTASQVAPQRVQGAHPSAETTLSATKLESPPLSSITLMFQTEELEKAGPGETAPEKAAAIKAAPVEAQPFESGLLASLANEAKQKLDAKQNAAEDHRARSQGLHEALDRLTKYFNPFIKHVNNAEPAINRIYQFDAKTAFSNLKWHKAILDYRKQGLSDTALYDYVDIVIYLLAPEPVPHKRPWGQMVVLKGELNLLKLRTLEDLEMFRKMPPQEWLQVNLEPEFPVVLRFKGNYEKGCIDVMARNIEMFGASSYKLDPKDVTPAFLDNLGLYLLSRADKLPAQLRGV